MFDLYAIGPWSDQSIGAMTTAAYEAYSRRLEPQSDRLPAARVAAIRHEDLVSHPVETLRAVSMRLGEPGLQPDERSIRNFVWDTRPPHFDAAADVTSNLTGSQRAARAACYQRVRDAVAQFLVAPDRIGRA